MKGADPKTNQKEITAGSYFKSLKLTRWELVENQGEERGGWQAKTVEVKDCETGENGMFRVLKSTKTKDRDRFYRELNVICEINHPNIIKILDFPATQDQYWYISKKGEPFVDFWKQKKRELKGDPDLLLIEAITILDEIASGLEEVHKSGNVHRDIKADNIVVYDGHPVLIDFGIVYVLGQKRLTKLNEAIANKYCPDPALYATEKVPKWLDVFTLSQLLIRMVSKGIKMRHIERPLDWRWIEYPRFSEINEARVRALTAQCSDQFVSPQDATEFRKLLAELFPQYTNEMTQIRDMEEIHAIIRKARVDRQVGIAEARPTIINSLPIFELKCQEIESQFHSLMESLTSSELPIDLQNDYPNTFVSVFSNKCRALKENLPHHLSAGFAYRIGEGYEHSFTIKMQYWCYTSEGVKYFPRYRFTENRPFISLRLFDDNDKLNGLRDGVKFVKLVAYDIFIDQSGKLNLYDEETKKFHPITIAWIMEQIADCVSDSEAWKVLYEQ